MNALKSVGVGLVVLALGLGAFFSLVHLVGSSRMATLIVAVAAAVIPAAYVIGRAVREGK